MNESQLTRKILKAIKKHHPDVWVYKTNDRFHSGIPDFLLCIKRRFAAIEIKISGKMPTKIQSYVLNEIALSGGAFKVCSSWQEVNNFIDSIKGGD